MRWIAELHRRGVFRALIVYVPIAWIAVELAAVTIAAVGEGVASLRSLVVAAFIGAPIVAALVWRNGARQDTAQRVAEGDSRRVISVLLVAVILGATVLAVMSFSPREEGDWSGIAILPLSDLSPSADYQYLADGIAEEIRNRLVAVPGLNVAARSSAFAFREQREDVRNIGEALNVDLVLDGSLRKSGDLVRVSLQLVDTESGFEIWTDSFDSGLGDIFAIQDQIASEIVSVIAPSQATAARGSLITTNFDAYDLYLLGRHNWRQRDPASLERALSYFDRAIAIDGQYAPAHAGRADTLLLLAAAGRRTAREAFAAADESIQVALQLDPLLGGAHASLGLLRLNQGNLVAAELALREALRIEPENSMAYMWLGLTLQQRPSGGPAEALEALQMAKRIDPLNPTIGRNLAAVLARLGRSGEALDLLGGLVDGGADSADARLLMAAVHLDVGRADAAVVALTETDVLARRPRARALLARALAYLGRFGDAQRWLAVGPGEIATVGQHWLDTAWISGARDDLEAVLYRETASPSWRWWSGLLAWQQGDVSAALVNFDTAASGVVGGDPHHTMTLACARAASLRLLGDADSALGVLRRARERGGLAFERGWNTPQLKFAMAWVEASLGNEEAGNRHLVAAVADGWRDLFLARSLPGAAQFERLSSLTAAEAEIRSDLEAQWRRVAKRVAAATRRLPGE